jgi:hypothetical protein
MLFGIRGQYKNVLEISLKISKYPRKTLFFRWVSIEKKNNF